MTEKELRKWLALEKAEDLWSVVINETVVEGFLRLEDVFELPEVSPTAQIQLLHKSELDRQDPPWVTLEPSSALSSKQRAHFEQDRRESAASLRWAFVIQAIVVFMILGGAFAFIFWPEEKIEIVPVDPMERVLSKMEIVRAERAQDGSSLEPSLMVSVGTSGRIIFVSNLSDAVWPRCEVIINDDYRYVWDEEIETGRTLHAPLRSFSNGEGSLDADETPPKQVMVIVPGFRVWKDRFK